MSTKTLFSEKRHQDRIAPPSRNTIQFPNDPIKVAASNTETTGGLSSAIQGHIKVTSTP